MKQYVVRKQDRLWEVRIDERLVSAQPSYEDALNLAQRLAYSAVQTGEPARIIVGSFDAVAVEFPILPPPRRPAVEQRT